MHTTCLCVCVCVCVCVHVHVCARVRVKVKLFVHLIFFLGSKNHKRQKSQWESAGRVLGGMQGGYWEM